MKKIYVKLIQMTLILIVSVTVVVSSSYAWMVLSGNPVATGIQVAVGGGTTILIAPDITETVDGEVYHYPGHFSDTMKFNAQPSYAFLRDVGGLTPVSTADGVNWFLPTYYDHTDEEVRQGIAVSGQLKEITAFTLENELEHANIPAINPEKIKEGSYLYLDFWVVSPSADFTLRVSTDDEGDGSFVVDLPNVIKVGEQYQMSEDDGQASAAVRVGFLANQLGVSEGNHQRYAQTYYYKEQYEQLRGLYQEPSSGSANLTSNRFTIYEPNGDLHPGDAEANGAYIPTRPITLLEGTAIDLPVMDRVTMRLTNSWKAADSGDGTRLSQTFGAAMLNKDASEMTPEEAAVNFYHNYLQWQVSTYVQKGLMMKTSAQLQNFQERITADQLAQLTKAGATDDVYIISLEKNIPQRIRMFIWLEGQDVDCVNEISASSMMINLELAGSSE